MSEEQMQKEEQKEKIKKNIYVLYVCAFLVGFFTAQAYMGVWYIVFATVSALAFLWFNHRLKKNTEGVLH